MQEVNIKRKPVYWYKNEIFHIIYRNNVEVMMRDIIMQDEIPMKYSEIKKDGDVSSYWSQGYTSFFYWQVPVIPEEDGKLPRMNGNQLWIREEGSPRSFKPAVELKFTEENGFRLHAADAYSIGDAIVFVSKFELSERKNLMGGIYMRYTDDTTEANAYLTATGMLRSLKNIKIGDEILCSTRDDMECIEVLDRVAISLRSMKLGRIGLGGTALFVPLHYGDDGDEVEYFSPESNQTIYLYEDSDP